MSTVTTDIDIDFADRNAALEGLPHIAATIDKDGKPQRHNSAVYFQNVPVNPLNGLCAFDHKVAAEKGYFKIDFLNNSIYAGIRDEDHLTELLNREPDWSMLEHVEIVGLLSHIHDHYGVVQAIKPRSIEDLAVVMALIRPGKRHLLSKTRAQIDAEIWTPGADGYTFKRAHAIAYAASIVVQLNAICEAAGREIDAGKVEAA